jgi:hypothetical protein
VLFNHGIKLYEQGDHTAAAEAFREAYRLRPSYKILFNLGQAEAASSRLGLAMEAFHRFLVDGGDDIPPDRKDYVINEINRLQALVGEFEVEAPNNSTIYVDGVFRGTTPMLTPVMVVGGKEHEVVIVHENEQLLKRRFSVWGGRKINIKAEKKKPEQAISEPDPVVEEQEETEEQQKLDPQYLWIGLGGTVVFGAGALAMELVIKDKRDEYKESADPDVKNDGEALQPVGIAFVALTGVALVTTGILAIFTDFSSLYEKESADSDVSTKLNVMPWALSDTGGFELRYAW